MHDPLSSSLEHGRARYHLSTLSLPFLSLINLISHVLLALKSNRIAAAAAAVTATHRSAMLGDYESICRKSVWIRFFYLLRCLKVDSLILLWRKLRLSVLCYRNFIIKSLT